MSTNISSSTPSAPAGNTNVTFQTDGSGNISGYMPSTPVLQTANSVDLTAQAANIAATNLVASPTAGMYEIIIYIIVTQVATTSSTLPSVVITWTDKDNTTSQTITATATSGGNALTTFATARVTVSSSTAAIQYSTTGYASSGATPMQYALHIRVESLT